MPGSGKCRHKAPEVGGAWLEAARRFVCQELVIRWGGVKEVSSESWRICERRVLNFLPGVFDFLPRVTGSLYCRVFSMTMP